MLAPARTDGKLVLDHPLTVADLGDGDRSAAGTVEPLAGAELLHHPSKGSLYLNFYYDLGECTPEEVQYLDLLTDILDELDTPEHTARELQTQRATWLGNSMACISFWTGRQEGSPCHAKLTWNMSLLERNLDKAIALGSEYLYKTCLTGPKAEEAFARVLSQQKLSMEQQFIQQGNQYAAVRAAAHYSVEYALSERCSGVTGYHFLCGLLEQADWAAMGKKTGSGAGKGAEPCSPDRQPAWQRGSAGKAACPAARQCFCCPGPHCGQALHGGADCPRERGIYH